MATVVRSLQSQAGMMWHHVPVMVNTGLTETEASYFFSIYYTTFRHEFARQKFAVFMIRTMMLDGCVCFVFLQMSP